MEWGITFDKPYTIAEKLHRRIAYADKNKLKIGICLKYRPTLFETEDLELKDDAVSSKNGSMAHGCCPR